MHTNIADPNGLEQRIRQMEMNKMQNMCVYTSVTTQLTMQLQQYFHQQQLYQNIITNFQGAATQQPPTMNMPPFHMGPNQQPSYHFTQYNEYPNYMAQNGTMYTGKHEYMHRMGPMG